MCSNFIHLIEMEPNCCLILHITCKIFIGMVPRTFQSIHCNLHILKQENPRPVWVHWAGSGTAVKFLISYVLNLSENKSFSWSFHNESFCNRSIWLWIFLNWMFKIIHISGPWRGWLSWLIDGISLGANSVYAYVYIFPPIFNLILTRKQIRGSVYEEKVSQKKMKWLNILKHLVFEFIR